MKGVKDKRNKLNDLTGTEWLKLTKSFWNSEKCADDKDAFNHPAPFLIKDVMKLISMFTKKDMIVLDPFCGSGTTLIAALILNRFGIGFDINEEYKKLSFERLNKKGFFGEENFKYEIGDACELVPTIDEVDYIVTSPPYHNILKNNGLGLRKENGNGFRNGSRLGIQYYSESKNDLGNKKTYSDFIKSLKEIMRKCYLKLKNGKYCTIIISDFTVNKKEICVQSDVVRMMKQIGFEFCGTTILLQDNKPLYPFGYPYAYKINHQHQNTLNFRKPSVIEK